MQATRVTLDTERWGALTFDVLVDGPADGEPVILLHGFPQTARSWRHQIEALAAAGYRVIAPDQRGYSADARPSDVAAYATLELVGDVLALADALSVDSFHLVGHDWGAAVAWQVAGRHADRVRSLTILSVPHPRAFGAALGPEASGEQAQRSGYIAMFQAEGAEHGMLANDAVGLRLIYLGSGLTEEEAEPYREALGTPEALGAALNWYRAADLTYVTDLGPITSPTLYVWSTEDPALGREAAEATARLRRGALHVRGARRRRPLDRRARPRRDQPSPARAPALAR